MMRPVHGRKPQQNPAVPGCRNLFDTVGGRYEPLQELGSGAVFLAHLARDARTGNEVALKRLRSDMLGSRNARYTMETEAAALMLVRHPGIPRLLSSSLSIPDPYLVEEFKDGIRFTPQNLRDSKTILRLLIYACDILSTLHDAGIVHRDLKPSNLVLGFDRRRLYVLDFGFSAVPGMQDYAQRVNIPVGTPMFMAPEQTYARARVDRRADIYSLGIISYAFLCGAHPYVINPKGNEQEEYFRAHRTQEAGLMHQHRPSVPERLSYAVARALSKDPARRYQDAEEFADALSGCLTAEYC